MPFKTNVISSAHRWRHVVPEDEILSNRRLSTPRPSIPELESSCQWPRSQPMATNVGGSQPIATNVGDCVEESTEGDKAWNRWRSKSTGKLKVLSDELGTERIRTRVALRTFISGYFKPSTPVCSEFSPETDRHTFRRSRLTSDSSSYVEIGEEDLALEEFDLKSRLDKSISALPSSAFKDPIRITSQDGGIFRSRRTNSTPEHGWGSSLPILTGRVIPNPNGISQPRPRKFQSFDNVHGGWLAEAQQHVVTHAIGSLTPSATEIENLFSPDRNSSDQESSNELPATPQILPPFFNTPEVTCTSTIGKVETDNDLNRSHQSSYFSSKPSTLAPKPSNLDVTSDAPLLSLEFLSENSFSLTFANL